MSLSQHIRDRSVECVAAASDMLEAHHPSKIKNSGFGLARPAVYDHRTDRLLDRQPNPERSSDRRIDEQRLAASESFSEFVESSPFGVGSAARHAEDERRSMPSFDVSL